MSASQGTPFDHLVVGFGDRAGAALADLSDSKTDEDAAEKDDQSDTEGCEG
jgi:hypothetical protein